MLMDRRTALSRLAGILALAPAAITRPANGQAPLKRVRMLLNTSYSGPQAWFLLAEDLGYFKREGLELEMTPGGGAYTAAPRMHASSFDFGYGDINALIEVAASNPDRAPLAVFVAFNASPSTIAVDANGPIRTPKDLEGRNLIGHDTDVALRTFSAFCKRTGVDATKVRIGGGGGMAGMVESMLGSNAVHGVFGYVSTLAAAIAASNPAMASCVRYMTYAEHVPDLYGSTLMVSRRFLKEDPAAVAGVVRSFNAGLVALMRDRDAGLASVQKRAIGSRKEIELLRLKTTLEIEMAHAEGKRIGIGDVDDARFARGIALLAETNALPRLPPASEIFTRQFLPPISERVTTLAK